MSRESGDPRPTPRSRYLDPSEPANCRRAIVLIDIMAAAEGLPAEQFDVLDRVLFGGRTMTEAAGELGIPRTTAMEHYKMAVAGLRRRIRNDPVFRILFDALRDELELH